jgi:hypothetical protein
MGKEMKEMQKVLGCLVPAAVPLRAVLTTHAVLDFIYYAQFQTHDSDSLQGMSSFHSNKAIFKELSVRDHFNIPKIHSMQHYLTMIRSHGSLDGYSTETSGWLHIDFAKNAYRASNKRDYIEQMALWLQRQEALSRFRAFLEWVEGGGNSGVDEDKGEDDDDE